MPEKPKKVEEAKVSERPIPAQQSAPATQNSQGLKPAPQTNDEILDVYDTYHNPEEIRSVMVIDSEIQRCNGLIS